MLELRDLLWRSQRLTALRGAEKDVARRSRSTPTKCSRDRCIIHLNIVDRKDGVKQLSIIVWRP